MTPAAPAAAASDASLWGLAVPPAVWLAHFLACYATAVAACGRLAAAPAVGIAPLVAVHTAAALGALAAAHWRWRGVRGDRPGGRDLDDDTPDSRHDFVATTHALLAAVAAIAILFVAGSTLVVPQCR